MLFSDKPFFLVSLIFLQGPNSQIKEKLGFTRFRGPSHYQTLLHVFSLCSVISTSYPMLDKG